MAAAQKIFSLEFEVFGKVQKVYLRKHTQEQAKKLGIHGWCMNTPEGTVKGKMEGTLDMLSEMKQWLKTTGSPKSRIEKATFSEEKAISNYTFKSFYIRR